MINLFKPQQCIATNLHEIEERLKRIETRLCKLMVALGHEDLLEPASTRLKKREQYANIQSPNHDEE